MSMQTNGQTRKPVPAHTSRPKESERTTRRPMVFWDRVKMLLLLLATTDFVFALDSLPAILGITQDPWILYTSNAFAILGMRVLYFLLAALLPKFRFLNYGLSIILVFIGLRMLFEKFVHLGTELTLGIVVLVLAGSIVASMAIPEKKA